MSKIVGARWDRTNKLLPKTNFYNHNRELFDCGQIYLFPNGKLLMQYYSHETRLRERADRELQCLAEWGIGQARLERLSAGQRSRLKPGGHLESTGGYPAQVGRLLQAGASAGLSCRAGVPRARSAASQQRGSTTGVLQPFGRIHP